MNLIWAAVVGAMVAAASYLMLARQWLRVVLGLSLLGSAINLSLLLAGRITPALPAFIDIEQTTTKAALIVNPLPQALILTAIVIGLGFFCVFLLLLMRIEADAPPIIEEPPPPPKAERRT